MPDTTRKVGYAGLRDPKKRVAESHEDRAESCSVAHCTNLEDRPAAGAVHYERQDLALSSIKVSSTTYRVLSGVVAAGASSLIMYPFHDRTWATWVWLSLTAVLGWGAGLSANRFTR